MITKCPDVKKDITIELSNPSFDIAMQYAIMRAEEHVKQLSGDYQPVSIKLINIEAKYVYATNKCKSVYEFEVTYSEEYR